MSLGAVQNRPSSYCVRTPSAQKQERKLKFLQPNRPQTAPPKPRPPEPRLLTTLKDAYSEWQERGGCATYVVEKLLKFLDKKQTNLRYSVLRRDDAGMVKRARACAAVDWEKCVVIPGNVDKTYRQYISLVLCPLTIKSHDQQVVKTHVNRQYLVREDDKYGSVIDSTTLLKHFTSLVKLTVPNSLVFRSSSYVEVTGLNGHSLHLYPVVPLKAGSRANSILPALILPSMNDLEKTWLMASCNSNCTFETFSRASTIELTVSDTFHRTVILLGELRMLHGLHLKLEDMVALATTAISDHIRETKYRGPIPLQHCFSLTVRLLLHTMQSTRVIRHPVTGDIMLRKLVFGRSLKRDAYIRDIIKTCVTFNKMQLTEEFLGLFPPVGPQDRELQVPAGLESDEDVMSDTGKLLLEYGNVVSEDSSSVVSDVEISD